MLVIQVLVFPVDLNFGRISPIFFTGANNISYLCMNLGTTRAQNYNYIAEKVGILEHMLMHMHGWSVGGNFCPHAAESVGPIICTLLQTDNHATTSSLRPDAVPDTNSIKALKASYPVKLCFGVTGGCTRCPKRELWGEI